MKQSYLENEKRITVVRKDGKKIVGYINQKKSDTVLLMCSGAQPLNTVRNFFHFLALYHTILPFPVLRFDFIGTGESDLGNLVDVQQRIDDLKTMVAHCRNKWKRVVLYAPSMGTLIAILAICDGLKIDKLISVNGLFNFKKVGLPVKYQVWLYRLAKPAEYQRQYAYVKHHYDESKVKLPTMVVYSSKDTWINPQQAIDFYNRYPNNKVLYELKGGQSLRTAWKESI